MAQFDIKSLTSVGANDLARALNGERITWDYMQASTDYFSTDIANLTSLTNVIKNLTILSAKQVVDGQFDVTSRISSSDVSEQTTIRTYGLFAHFNTEKPALMAIISDKTGDVLYPVSQTTNPQDLQQTMSLIFPNPDGKPIPYVISSSGYAMNTEVLHTTRDETVTGTKTFQKIKISNTKFPNLVQTDGQSITLDGGTKELVPADDSKVIHNSGTEEIAGQKTYDIAPIDKTTGKPFITVDGVPKPDHPFDTDGWVKAEGNSDKGTNNLYYRIKDSVLYVLGSVEAGLAGYIKINPKWILPNGAMFTEAFNNIGRADTCEYYIGKNSGWGYKDYLINLNNSGQSTQYSFNFSLPIA